MDEYKVQVNFGGFIGADVEYQVYADSEEDAIILAEEEAKDDLNVEDWVQTGDESWDVTISFSDLIGVELTYSVEASDEGEAINAALEEASWDLSGEIDEDDDDDDEDEDDEYDE